VNCCAGGTQFVAVSPDLVGFAESARLKAVASGPDLQAILDAYRRFWTYFCGSFWKIRDLIRLRREVWEPAVRSWAEISTTLTSPPTGPTYYSPA
jgi:hypothetical protein